MNLFYSLILTLLVFFSNHEPRTTSLQESPYTWVGIDYSHTKFVGADGFPEPGNLPRMMLAWNDFVITEPEKYDVKKLLKTSQVKIDLSYTYQKNGDLDTYKMIDEMGQSLNQEEVAEIVKTYDFSELEGTVVMLVAECYNKKANEGSHWLVMVDPSSGKVLSSERYVEKPGGFGLRNYWARTIYELFKSREKSRK